jgi:hypothetical protein
MSSLLGAGFLSKLSNIYIKIMLINFINFKEKRRYDKTIDQRAVREDVQKIDEKRVN